MIEVVAASVAAVFLGSLAFARWAVKWDDAVSGRQEPSKSVAERRALIQKLASEAYRRDDYPHWHKLKAKLAKLDEEEIAEAEGRSARGGKSG